MDSDSSTTPFSAMDAFENGGADYLGALLHFGFYGLHVALYLFLLGLHRYRGTKSSGRLTIYSSVLFLLCTAAVIIHSWEVYDEVTSSPLFSTVDNLDTSFTVVYGLVDILAQFLMVYRCWIIWDKRYAVVFLPALLATASFAGILAIVIIPFSEPDLLGQLIDPMSLFAYTTSMAVNTIVLILIVSRIWILSRQFAKIHGTPMDSTYTVIIAMLLESGLTIFLAQLCFVVLYAISSPGFNVIQGLIIQIYGFTPTILLIRVAIGASYDSQTMMSAPIVFAAEEKQTRQQTNFSSEHTNTVYDLTKTGSTTPRELEEAA
ncbi:hypothetical protein BDQ12DRAFT_724214 [Crucibulum laeve]|uniref:Uncharacterized protein n=1 Tax=Crucibulum laeve TaxID=68775 RepID=A0A5C3LY75_9AGAR|nr:hypothetical protein BDQ12DRAFT_724214 [Crucibulum laeve]